MNLSIKERFLLVAVGVALLIAIAYIAIIMPVNNKIDDRKAELAVKIAKENYPDLVVDGELQLDAALVPEVAALKAPNSEVAGKANVVIWPDLNVGNVGVKLIQTFGKADAYGPMLQGFNKVVCDCSRGAPVSEIKGNIVISAVRAAGLKK
mgnify:CR=1 FL=1